MKPILRIIFICALTLLNLSCIQDISYQSCKNDCDDKHDLCERTGMLYGRTPDGSQVNIILSYFYCQAEQNVCRKTCSNVESRE